MSKGINVLSLFGGIETGLQALKELDIKVNKYYSSEIDKRSLEVTKYNHPEVIHLGDITKWKEWNIPENIDLIFNGSPCQDLSIAMSNRKGLEGNKSSLFYVAKEIMGYYKPTYFLFENVARMPKEDKEIITKLLGVEPIRINSKLVTGALRDRLYWTNIPQKEELSYLGIKLQDVLIEGYTDREKARALLSSDSRPLKDPEKMYRRYTKTGFTTIVFKDKNLDYKKGIRYLNQTELERLQGFPEGYTKPLNRNQAAFCLGNAWTLPVIKHLIKPLKEIYER